MMETASKLTIMAKKNITFATTLYKPAEFYNILPAITKCIWAEDRNIQYKAAYCLRKYIDHGVEGAVEAAVAAGIIPRFVEFLLSDCPPVQHEAVCILETIATVIDYSRELVNHDAVFSFVQLLSSPVELFRSKATRALAFLLKDFKDLLQIHGALEPILLQLSKENTKLSFFRDTVRVLALLVDGMASISTRQMGDVLLVLDQLLQSADVDVLVHACYALASLTHERTLEDVQIVHQSLYLGRLVQLLGHPSPIVVRAALLIMSDLSSNHIQMRKYFIAHQLLPKVFYLLGKSNVATIQIATCLLLCSLIQGSHDLVQYVIDAHIISALVALWRRAEPDVRRVVACTISDGAYYRSNHQILYLVGQGCIAPLCSLLTCENLEFLAAGLDRLENILRVGEELKQLETTRGRFNAYAKCIEEATGLQKLEGLQLHQNPIISQKAMKLLETYWLEEVKSQMIPLTTQPENCVIEALDQMTSLLES